MDAEPLVIACPYCLRILGTIDVPDAPFEIPARCKHCDADPRNDAALELTLERWMALAKRPCVACGEPCPVLATRCAACRNRPHAPLGDDD